MTYYDELTRAMTVLGEHAESIFYGQAIAYEGTGMTASFKNVPREKLVELPVFENTQLGISIGESLCGALPICVYPRINFLLEATSQLVQHLDKIPIYSAYRPKVIIRTAVATDYPLDPGPQHLGDYADALACMVSKIEVIKLERARDIVAAYQYVTENSLSSIIVEYVSKYDEN